MYYHDKGRQVFNCRGKRELEAMRKMMWDSWHFCFEMFLKGEWGVQLWGDIRSRFDEWIIILPSSHCIWNQICHTYNLGYRQKNVVYSSVTIRDSTSLGSCFPFILVLKSSRIILTLLQPLMAVTVSETKENICLSFSLLPEHTFSRQREERAL